MPQEDVAWKLRTQFLKALAQVPTENWGYFFPCMIGIWRFLFNEIPGLLGPLDAEYDTEPVLRGKNAEWFLNDLIDDSEVVGLLEQLMYPLCKDLRDKGVFRRGLVQPSHLEALEQSAIVRLTEVVLRKAVEVPKSRYSEL